MKNIFAKKIVLTLTLICAVVILTGMKIPENMNVKNNSEIEKSQSFTMILTHLQGEKLNQNAHFIVGDIKVWTLDMRNGDKLKYTITGRVGNDAMCGVTAKDNFGDICAICIEKKSGDNVEVEFRYSAGIMTYTGYLSR